MDEIVYYGADSPQAGQVKETISYPDPQPNNAGNQYFGKRRVSGSIFIGMIISALGVPAANRLMADPAFLAIKTWLQTSGVIVDVDDKQGNFLKIVQYVQTTMGSDGRPLINPQDVATILSAWK